MGLGCCQSRLFKGVFVPPWLGWGALSMSWERKGRVGWDQLDFLAVMTKDLSELQSGPAWCGERWQGGERSLKDLASNPGSPNREPRWPGACSMPLKVSPLWYHGSHTHCPSLMPSAVRLTQCQAHGMCSGSGGRPHSAIPRVDRYQGLTLRCRAVNEINQNLRPWSTWRSFAHSRNTDGGSALWLLRARQ